MSGIERELLMTWAAVTLYFVSGLLSSLVLIFKKDKLLTPSLIVAWAGLVVHGAAIIMRWIDVGHGPYFRVHEIVSSDVWVGVLFFLILCIRFPRWSVIGTFVMPIAFSLLAWAAFADPSVEPLSPTFKTPWLVLHVIFAKLAFGAILVAFGLSCLYLWKRRKARTRSVDSGGANGNEEVEETLPAESSTEITSFTGRLPSLDRMDDLSKRFVAFGFVFLGAMIIAGAIWAQQSWGRYWQWDPIETWSLLIWLLYGLFLHLRITYKVKGAVSAWLIIGILVVSLFYFFGVTLFSVTIHEGTTL